jgi:predicted dehydrogenase
MFRNIFAGAAHMSKKWFSKKEISGGGVLIDNGAHAVDLFRFLFGEVRNVSARVATFVQDIEVEDTARVLIEMENGALGSTDLSWSIPIPQDLFLEIYGSEGSIMVGLNNVRYRTERSGKWVEVRKNKDSLDPFSKEVNHFVECIQGKESPIVEGVDGLRALEVIEAAYESANQKTWTKVKLTKI